MFFSLLVIACKPSFPSYLAALNPIDQVFDFEELEYHYQVANRTEDVTAKDQEEDDEENDEKDENKEKKEGDDATANGDGTLTNLPTIDNPYLRAAKGPKRMKFDSGT